MKLYAHRSETSDNWQYALFDLSKDSGENDNVAAQQPAVFKDMCADMWAWAASVHASQSKET
eukprot:gene15068-9036_t